MELVKGLEPSISAWKANVLPLHYTRVLNCLRCGDPAGEEDPHSRKALAVSCEVRAKRLELTHPEGIGT